MKNQWLRMAGILVIAAVSGCGRYRSSARWDAVEFSRRFDKVLTALKATPEQRSAAQAIKERLLPEVLRQKAAAQTLSGEFLVQWVSSNPDAGRLRLVLDAGIEELRLFAHKRVDDFVAFHAILTLEQRLKVAKMTGKRG